MSDPPQWIAPMKAVLVDEAFSDPGWVYERKLDGIRSVVFRDRKTVRLMSRNRLEQNERFGALADAVAAQPCERFVADGEIVAFDGAVTSFARLQRQEREDVPVFLYLFDLMWIDGDDLRDAPLSERKQRLKAALSWKDPIRFTPHRRGEGEAFLAEACDKGWEGLIAKRADSPYRSARSKDWRKLKCVNEQELVIGGYTDPQGSRKGFGALLVGYYEDDELRYAGKVGTGFDDVTLEELGGRLASMERKSSPFADPPKRKRGVHWVTPKLVGQLGFTEWTRDGRLRHPRFLGLRDDKAPEEVVRERPASG